MSANHFDPGTEPSMMNPSRSELLHADTHQPRLPLIFRGHPRPALLAYVFEQHSPPNHCLLCQVERIHNRLADQTITFEEVFAACLFRWNFLLEIQRITDAQMRAAVMRIGKRHGVTSLDGTKFLPAIRVSHPRIYWVGKHRFIFGMVSLGADPGGLAIYHWANGRKDSVFACWGGESGEVLSPTAVADVMPPMSAQERLFLATLYAISHRVASAPHTIASPINPLRFILGAKLIQHLKELPSIERETTAFWALRRPFTLMAQEDATKTRCPVWVDYADTTADPEVVSLKTCPVRALTFLDWIEQQRLPGESDKFEQLPKLVLAQKLETNKLCDVYVLEEP